MSAVLILLIAAAVQVFAQPVRVHGDCMEPAIRDGQWCFVNRLAYWRDRPARGEIVLFRHDRKVWVSRIVAVAWDRVEITHNGIIVNGEREKDVSVVRDWHHWNQHGTHGIGAPLEVPDAHVYVLSDNLSAGHDDSRVFGPIAVDDIIGRNIQ